MKNFIIVLIVVCIMCMFSCTDASRKNYTTLGKPGIVKLYSGGKLVGEWKSTGKIITLDGSDGWQFVDSATNKLIRVTGAVVIEN